MKPVDPSQVAASVVPSGPSVRPGAGRRLGSPAGTATLLFVSALTIMSAAAIAPALPAIESNFRADADAPLLTRLLITMPALVIALVAPVAGSLTDRVGRRRVLIGAVLLYGAAGTSGLVLETLYGLLIGRALLGAAVAGIMTASTALVGDLYSGSDRDRFMGLQAAFTGAGGLVFMTAGGLLAEASWRMPFAIYGLAFVLLPAVILTLHEPQRTGQGPIQAATAERGTRVPWLPTTALFLTAAFNSVIFYLIPTQLPFYLHTLGVGSPGIVGLTIGVFNLSIAAASLGYGRIRGLIGLLGTFGLGFGLMALGYGLVATAESHSQVLVGLVVTGVGMSGVMPGLMAGAMTIAPPAARGRVAGGLTASIFLGQFLSPLVSQAWIGWFGYAAAFRDMGLLLAAAALAAITLAGWAAGRRLKPRSGQD